MRNPQALLRRILEYSMSMAISFLLVVGAISCITTPALAVPITYWNVFNLEGESSLDARIVTYAGLTDMLADTNRTGNFAPGGFSRNIIGSGAGLLNFGPVPVPEPGTLALMPLGLFGLL